jgi:heme/copper-type cytochrome/quinol oxidase subunit 2
MSLLATVLTETEELAPLIMSPFAFAGIAVAVFVALGFVTWSFRDVANRHSQKTSASNSHTAGH